MTETGTATECPYCGCDPAAHDPVVVAEGPDGDRDPVGTFCNYACLRSWIDETGATDGAVCRLDQATDDATRRSG